MEHVEILTNRRGENHVGKSRRSNSSINRNRSRIGRKKFHQQIKQSRFTCATLPDDGKLFAALNRQAEVVKNFLAAVAEAEIFNFNGLIGRQSLKIF